MLSILGTILSVFAALAVVLGPAIAQRIAAGDPEALKAAYDQHAGNGCWRWRCGS